jgi:hypothetical protein
MDGTCPSIEGGLGTLGWLAVGIAAVVFGPKVYHSIFGK